MQTKMRKYLPEVKGHNAHQPHQQRQQQKLSKVCTSSDVRRSFTTQRTNRLLSTVFQSFIFLNIPQKATWINMANIKFLFPVLQNFCIFSIFPSGRMRHIFFGPFVFTWIFTILSAAHIVCHFKLWNGKQEYWELIIMGGVVCAYAVPLNALFTALYLITKLYCCDSTIRFINKFVE